MEIIVAEKCGFCFGVQKAYKQCQKHFGTRFETFGPLIHNPEILKRIEQEGGKIVKKAEKIESETVIVRAHGISRKNLRAIQNKGVQIEDATCPFVQTLQKKAQDLAKQGLQVVIIGQVKHPEIRAITEDIPESIVVFSAEEAEALPQYQSIGLVSQTTEQEEKFAQILEILRGKCEHLEYQNTICHDVRERQKAARKLAQEVDVLIVVGGQKSSNTNKIWQICQKHTMAYKVEDEAEIKADWLKNCQKCGVITGASTPSETLERVLKRLKKVA